MVLDSHDLATRLVQLLKSFEYGSEILLKSFAEIPDEELSVKLYEVINFEYLENELVKIYEQIYSQEELQGLISFYESPVGTKYLELRPKIDEEIEKISTKYMGKITPKLEAIVDGYFGTPPSEK